MAEHDRSDVLLTDEVRELVALMKNSDLAELLIERGDAKLHLKRATAAAPIVAPAPVYAASAPVYAAPAPGMAPVAGPAASPAAPLESAAEAEAMDGVAVTAPMVGTFYASPSPKDPPYVQVGDEVKPGDVLGIIEAMKIMNEIECEVHGRVVRLLVQSGQAVEYGQSLLIIEPL